MTQVLPVVEIKVAYMEKSMKFCSKQKNVEMNKLSLDANKTELIFFRAIILILDLFVI